MTLALPAIPLQGSFDPIYILPSLKGLAPEQIGETDPRSFWHSYDINHSVLTNGIILDIQVRIWRALGKCPDPIQQMSVLPEQLQYLVREPGTSHRSLEEQKFTDLAIALRAGIVPRKFVAWGLEVNATDERPRFKLVTSQRLHTFDFEEIDRDDPSFQEAPYTTTEITCPENPAHSWTVVHRIPYPIHV